MWTRQLSALNDDFKQEEKTGLLSPGQKTFHAKLVKLLMKWTPDPSLAPKEAFTLARSGFNDLREIRSLSVRKSASSLENAFTFMEDAFGEGQEMVIFITELTLDPDISAFISENGCERYFKYNKSLLIGSRRAEILAELDHDAIYSDASAYDF